MTKIWVIRTTLNGEKKDCLKKMVRRGGWNKFTRISECMFPLFSDLNCKGQLAPANANLHCTKESNSQEVHCELTCNAGYDVKYLAAKYYVCKADGKWSAVPSSADTRWPDCKIYGYGKFVRKVFVMKAPLFFSTLF